MAYSSATRRGWLQGKSTGGRQTEAARFRRQVGEKNRRCGQTVEKTEVMLGHPHRVKPQFFRQEAFGVDVV